MLFRYISACLFLLSTKSVRKATWLNIDIRVFGKTHGYRYLENLSGDAKSFSFSINHSFGAIRIWAIMFRCYVMQHQWLMRKTEFHLEKITLINLDVMIWALIDA